MSANSRPPETLVATAAALRAAGEAWDNIAKEIGRSSARIRHWPREYPDDWNRAFRHAENQILRQAANEAVHTLRRLMRSDDEKIARGAANDLLNYRLKVRELARRERADQPPPEPPKPPEKTYAVDPKDPASPRLSKQQMLDMLPERLSKEELELFDSVCKSMTLEESTVAHHKELRKIAARDTALAIELGFPIDPATGEPIVPKPKAPDEATLSTATNEAVEAEAVEAEAQRGEMARAPSCVDNPADADQ